MSVSFIYGDCAPVGDSGCPAPAEIQIWPACIRNPSLYDKDYGPPSISTTIRGVPAAYFEGGARLELQTGKSTVVIFGATQAAVDQIAQALQGVNGPTQRTDPLPPPAPGSLTSTLAC